VKKKTRQFLLRSLQVTAVYRASGFTDLGHPVYPSGSGTMTG